LKRWVFERLLKIVSDGADVTFCGGRVLFHSLDSRLSLYSSISGRREYVFWDIAAKV